METLASILRHLAPTKSDMGVVGLGTAAPFLAGAVPLDHGFDFNTIATGIAVAATTTIVGMVGKGVVAGAGAYIRAKVRRWRLDKDPSNDDAADALEAVADAVDPAGKATPPPSGAPFPLPRSDRGPQP